MSRGTHLTIALLGQAIFLWGLSLDAWLHYRDPALIERETLFSLANPGHGLVFVGMAVTLVGLFGMVWSSLIGGDEGAAGAEAPDDPDAPPPARRPPRGLVITSVLVATGLAGVGAMSQVAEGSSLPSLSGGGGHVHGDVEIARADDGRWEMRTSHNNAVAVTVSEYSPDMLPTLDQMRAAVRLYEDTRAGTLRFQDHNVAVREGYSVSERRIEGRPQQGTIDHLFSPAYARDGRTMDPERPESLIYGFMRTGIQLLGAMYIMPMGEQGPQIGGPLTLWHYHPGAILCVDAWGIPAGMAVDGPCPPGSTQDSPEMLHVWLVDNAFGTFAHHMSPVSQPNLRDD